MKMKKIICLALALCLSVALFASCTPVTTEKTAIKIAALKGPTGIGFAKMFDSVYDSYECDIELYGAPTDVVGLVAGKKVDIAAVPANVAATLYKKTEGKVKIIALTVLGSLYVLSNQPIDSIDDLASKKIALAGQGATPEYALKYVLQENEITNCEIEFFSEHAEVVTNAVNGNADIILLPEPFVSVMLSKNAGFSVCLDLDEEWNKVSTSSLSMGVLIASAEFCENNPEVLNAFLEDYAESVNFANDADSTAAAIVAEKGILASEQLAKTAIPNCKITAIFGNDMKTKLMPFFQLLHQLNPATVGGKVPNEDFYYTNLAK